MLFILYFDSIKYTIYRLYSCLNIHFLKKSSIFKPCEPNILKGIKLSIFFWSNIY